MDALTTTVECLSAMDARYIVRRLTKDGSEFRAEVTEKTSSTPIAIVRTQEATISAWVATHHWQGMQTLEGFTHERLRRRGMATVGASMLIAAGLVDPSETVAVFAPEFVTIATRAGCRDVRLYERRGSEGIQNS